MKIPWERKTWGSDQKENDRRGRPESKWEKNEIRIAAGRGGNRVKKEKEAMPSREGESCAAAG